MTEPEGRFAGLTINTVDEFKEQVEYVLTHPEIGGFDCMLALSFLIPTTENKAAAVAFAMRGIKVKLQVIEPDFRETHVRARILITPPLVIKADPSA